MARFLITRHVERRWRITGARSDSAAPMRHLAVTVLAVRWAGVMRLPLIAKTAGKLVIPHTSRVDARPGLRRPAGRRRRSRRWTLRPSCTSLWEFRTRRAPHGGPG